MYHFNRIPPLIVVGALLAASPAMAVEAKDAAIIVSYFLHIAPPGADSLERYKQIESIYVKYRDARPATEETIKMFLLIAHFIGAHESGAGALAESFNSDMVPLFTKHRAMFLRVLRGVPLLARSACHFLGAHFGFEDVPRRRIAGFVAAHRRAILEGLGPNEGGRCLAEIRGPSPGPQPM